MELKYEDKLITELDEGIVCKDSLSKKFWKGLEEKHGLTYEDIIKEGWAYAGGDSNSHYNYFLLITRWINLMQPPHLERCVCNQKIHYNCYIVNRVKTKIIVIGSCCINSFMPDGKKGRTCDICEKPHRNRKVNKCNNCRDKCSRCKTDITSRFGYEKYERCRSCEYIKECIKCKKEHKNRGNKCNDCNDKCSRCKTQFKSNYGYEKCYGCMYIKECIKCKKEHKNSVDKCDHCCNRFKCGVCADCGKNINEKYKMCYTCYKKK